MKRYPQEYEGQTQQMIAADIRPGDIVMASILAGKITLSFPA